MQEGKNEGEVCNVDGCEGIIQYPKVINCSCHISPPCSACVDNELTCTECERVIE